MKLSMFNRNDNNVETLLGANTQFKGNIVTKGTLKLYGTVLGNIETDWLITGEGSSINGNVTAGGIIVGGEVTGNLVARERVEIRKKGTVRGDISTSRLLVEDGGLISGKVSMEGVEPGKPADQPSPPQPAQPFPTTKIKEFKPF